MTNKQAADVAAKIGAGAEVRMHPKCDSGANPWYYAVCGKADDGAVDKGRTACVQMGIGYCVEPKPAWA